MKHLILTLYILITCLPLFSQWTLISPHDIDYSYNDVFFLNNDTGYVVGDSAMYEKGIILKTVDGGSSWDTIFTNGPVYSIQFLSNDIGFAGSDNSFFYKTVDGGVNWEEVIVPLIGNYYQTNNSIHFRSTDIGFLCSTRGPGGGRLSWTIDGGQSWQNVFINMTGNFAEGGGISFTSNNIGHVGMRSKTYDSGLTWFSLLDSLLGIPSPVQCVCNDYLSENFGMIGGWYMEGSPVFNNRGLIGITCDGGYNFIIKEFHGLYRIRDIQIVDENRVFAVGDLCPPSPEDHSMFLASVDGGNSWYYQEYEQDIIYLYPIMHAICFPIDKTGYAVSYFGQIYKTTNSGGDLIPIPDTLSIIENSNIELLSVYPNPATDIINIKCDNLKMKEFSLVIYNSNGQLVQNRGSYLYDNNYLRVNVSSLRTGIYFLKLTDGRNAIMQKFIKN